jgi:branched-chain amino acid transport system ATP-binding protein
VSTRPLLELQNVGVTYGAAILAVRGVTLTVGQGEIVALLGANGAGKSSTLRAVSNLLPAKRGRISGGIIRFGGVDTTGWPTSRLVSRGLVQVLEGRHCFRALTVEENLVTGALGRASTRAETALDLEKVYALFPRLKAKRGIAAGLASGGEQQMVAIGRALMARPRLLVLDEPSMGLAPIVVAEIFKTLTTLNRVEGLSILLAEQNTAVALKAAHRGVVLENGQVKLSGDAAELRGRDDIRAAYLGIGDPAIPSSISKLSERVA